MTTYAVPQHRAARRLRLIGLIRQATDELAALERADHRTHQLAAHIRPNLPPEYTEGTPLSRADGPTIRAWAHANGIPTRQYGAIPKALRRAYTAAHPNEATP